MMATIRDLLLRGEYPTDDRGRALVPTRLGTQATILSPHGLEPQPIVGILGKAVECWGPDGRYWEDGEACEYDLLPPGERSL